MSTEAQNSAPAHDRRRGTGVFIPVTNTSRLPGKSVSFSVHQQQQQGPASCRHHAPIKSKSFGATTSQADPNNKPTPQVPAAASREFWQQPAQDQPALPAHAINPAGCLWRTNSSPLPSAAPSAGWQPDQQEAAAVAAAAAAATTSWCGSLAGPAHQQWAAAAAAGSTAESSADYEGCWTLDEELACRSAGSNSSQCSSHSEVMGRTRLHDAAFFGPPATAGIAPAAAAGAAAMACASGCSLSASLPSLNAPGPPMGSLQSLSAPLPLVLADSTADATVELINCELERLLALRQQLTAGRGPGSSSSASLDQRTLAAMAGDGGFSPLAALTDQQQQLALEQAREKLQQLQLMQQLQLQLEMELLQLLPMHP